MRMRRFTAEEEAVAQFLVAQAGKRIEMLGHRAARRAAACAGCGSPA